LHVGHDRFLLHIFQFIIHYSSCDLILHVVVDSDVTKHQFGTDMNDERISK